MSELLLRLRAGNYANNATDLNVLEPLKDILWTMLIIASFNVMIVVKLVSKQDPWDVLLAIQATILKIKRVAFQQMVNNRTTYRYLWG